MSSIVRSTSKISKFDEYTVSYISRGLFERLFYLSGSSSWMREKVRGPSFVSIADSFSPLWRRCVVVRISHTYVHATKTSLQSTRRRKTRYVRVANVQYRRRYDAINVGVSSETVGTFDETDESRRECCPLQIVSDHRQSHV